MQRKVSQSVEEMIAELDRMERFLEGEEQGEIPLDILRDQGLEIPDDDSVLDDVALHALLWKVIEAMASLGLLLDDTDHLSDRELYRYLVHDALVEETILSSSAGRIELLSPIGGCSAEDHVIYLRYYADDQAREEWQRDHGTPPPSKEPRPYDRDRLLPG